MIIRKIQSAEKPDYILGLEQTEEGDFRVFYLEPYKDQSVNTPVDMNDPEHAETAVEFPFPENFSQKAKQGIKYLEGAIALFYYNDKFVVTDESLCLTEHGDGSENSPVGCPRWTGESLLEMEKWLEAVADDQDDLELS